MNEAWIAPSILSADFSRLGEEVRAVVEAGADLVHFDVMDNHYVPNLTIGPPVCESLRRFMDGQGIDAAIDVHLMINPVEALIPSFAKAGAGFISFHPDTCRDVGATIQAIRAGGCRPGLVFSPDVPLDALEQWLPAIDLVLIMSVHPGFGGQAFIESTLAKVAAARALIDHARVAARLEVDGGITLANVGSVAAAGADTFVAGSAIYRSADYRATIAGMRRQIAAARAL